MTDAAACERACEEHLGDVTHVVYGAIYEKPGDLLSSWVSQEQRETNDAMLRNFLNPLGREAAGLQHFSIMQVQLKDRYLHLSYK